MPTPPKATKRSRLKRPSLVTRSLRDQPRAPATPAELAALAAACLDTLGKALSHGERLATLSDHLATMAQQERARADALAGELAYLQAQHRGKRGRS